MPGKKKVMPRDVTWVLNIETDEGTKYVLQIRGTSNPLESLLHIDITARRYLLALTDGLTVTNVKITADD